MTVQVWAAVLSGRMLTFTKVHTQLAFAHLQQQLVTPLVFLNHGLSHHSPASCPLAGPVRSALKPGCKCVSKEEASLKLICSGCLLMCMCEAFACVNAQL